MKRMEAENPLPDTGTAHAQTRPPVEQQKPPKKDEQEEHPDVVHVGQGSPERETGDGSGTGRIQPSLIEADAVNRNYTKTNGGKPGENLDNPSPLHHIDPKNWKPTSRMRKVRSQSHRY